MNLPYTYLNDLTENSAPPEDGIVSRTVYNDNDVKVMLFGFGPGQELSEHTASKPAMLYFVDGEGTVGLGADTHPVQAGSFVHMPAELKHSVHATTQLRMLLVLLKSAAAHAPAD